MLVVLVREFHFLQRSGEKMENGKEKSAPSMSSLNNAPSSSGQFAERPESVGDCAGASWRAAETRLQVRAAADGTAGRPRAGAMSMRSRVGSLDLGAHSTGSESARHWPPQDAPARNAREPSAWPVRILVVQSTGWSRRRAGRFSRGPYPAARAYGRGGAVRVQQPPACPRGADGHRPGRPPLRPR